MSWKSSRVRMQQGVASRKTFHKHVTVFKGMRRDRGEALRMLVVNVLLAAVSLAVWCPSYFFGSPPVLDVSCCRSGRSPAGALRCFAVLFQGRRRTRSTTTVIEVHSAVVALCSPTIVPVVDFVDKARTSFPPFLFLRIFWANTSIRVNARSRCLWDGVSFSIQIPSKCSSDNGMGGRCNRHTVAPRCVRVLEELGKS